MKAITTKFHGPTNTRGSRISASDGDNKVFINYDHASDNPHRDAAVALCRKLKWTGKMVEGGTKVGSVFVFLPLDLMLASRGRTCSDVIDLSLSDEEIQNIDKACV